MEWVVGVVVIVDFVVVMGGLLCGYYCLKRRVIRDCARLLGRANSFVHCMLRELDLETLLNLRRVMSGPETALFLDIRGPDDMYRAIQYAMTTSPWRGENIWRSIRHALATSSWRKAPASLFSLRPKAERWLVSLSYWIPRRYREPVVGDILEDCHEMRELGFRESRIRIHVLWQFAIAVVALWPEAVASAIAAVVKRVWSTKK